MKNIWIILLSLFLVSECKSQNISNNAILRGSIDSLYRAINSETILPIECKQSGKVFIDYLITESGEIHDVSVAKGLCPVADSIAINIVKRLKYIPAKSQGKPVPARKSIPIYFKRE